MKEPSLFLLPPHLKILKILRLIQTQTNVCVQFYSMSSTIFLGLKPSLSLLVEDPNLIGYINGSIQIPPLSSGYGAWVTKDHLVMSWLLNSMEPLIAAIFSYSESSQHLWKFVKEMYGNQNNSARIFQL
jgi:hypothetical protein